MPLSGEEKLDIADRVRAGDKLQDIANDYGVSKTTIAKHAKNLGAQRPVDPKVAKAVVDGGDVREFEKRAKSILWRQESGKEHPTYDAWKARIELLMGTDGAGYTKSQAIIQASKDFPCLHKLFREYDTREFDPNPDSHAQIQKFGSPIENAEATCEGIQQSYRDSIRWAITAAGHYLRMKAHPTSVPCDAAWYLYCQAIDSPKDFMSKVGQIEAKADAEYEAERTSRKAGSRSIEEIDNMLASLSEDEDELENADEAIYNAELQVKAAKAQAEAEAKRTGTETKKENEDSTGGDRV